MKNRSSFETLIGALVLAAAVFFVVLVVRGTGVTASDGYKVSASFGNADGLKPGTEVRISGVKVGSVVEQSLDATSLQAKVVMEIDPSLKLPIDSSVRVLSDGLLGGSYLMIDPGGDEENLADGGHIDFTSDAVNLIDLISTAVFSQKEE
ncbi:outer membrane lipid asymmetry maintenance protein MlaD [Alphaproteobacteria bacterium]|nr:outer membrane lipid asymmetry maintenance protein MlaD [Alphaproteobacteria bacterium]